MDYKDTLEEKKINSQNTGNFKNCLFIFDNNCPEFNTGRNSKSSENIFMVLL